MIRALLAATAALALSAPALADTLVDNVDGLTIDATGGVERFTGLLIGDDGRIVQVLHRGDKRPGKVDYFVDGQGQVMVPGMIDSHGHVMSLGFSALTLDLTDTKSLAEALAKVAAYAKVNPDRPWILGRGWNQELWPEKRFPTAAELDAVIGDRPVWLERVDGHAGWANSKALAAAGVTALTKAPAGGSIERLPGGKPAGVLVDNATELVAKAVPAPRPEDRDLALAKAQEILLARGVTAIADMGTTVEDWQSFRRAGDNGSLRVRIMAYAMGTDNMALIGGPGPSPWLYDDKLRLNGVKLYADGALGSRGASLKAPYSDAPTVKGLRVTGDTQLKNFMSRAALDRFQVAIHAIGDEANAAALTAIEDMNQTYTGDRRWRIEHAQVVDPADIPRFAKAGVIASMQPVHQTSDRLMAEARLGPNRLAGAYAWASLAASGARLAFGSDVPVELADPWAGFAAAISRTGPDGQPFGGWQPQERVSRELALAAYTSGGAYAGFAEGRFGRLQRGERADFLLIDRDPMLASPAEIRATQVMQVWVGGRPVHQHGN
ncbi:amidohydrolase [Novosphingobium ginsenosidimutans]|uniref:Amidohydrolase n=1 Tax=Novosphingobium ginsenosidimutans TaxID=1176536 RepID=A0A5B8S1I4_9SPHN|nr:amidohydrolase [Novosphingobium ginsenosidimutans]QEA14922.1 amidohydrolase [Novosphingobium ginsenosidimutans]